LKYKKRNRARQHKTSQLSKYFFKQKLASKNKIFFKNKLILKLQKNFVQPRNFFFKIKAPMLKKKTPTIKTLAL
jgi:hypothetical protein